MAQRFEGGSILGLFPGDVVEGRFQVGQLIGYGGQGVVLSVNHLEWARNLALKLPLPEAVDSPKKTERFIREAEAWIRLGVHPNIVRCWFVRRVSGLPGLFLDLISGGSVEDKIKSREISAPNWERILQVITEVAEGLSHAHGLGMIHRDIKPENLLMTPQGSIRVTDFGLVKSVDRSDIRSPSTGERGPSDAGATGTGEFLGTPRYGAPEQWHKGMGITPATDIYAVGVVLFELLTSRRPFDAPRENPDPLVLINRHLQDPVPLPSQFQPDIPEPLQALCLRCLSKNPAERPQNGAELVAALSELRQSYTPPAPLPEKDRPALLNNAGVSLISLGLKERGRENIEKGLLLQADHPECTYNLVQLERRSGQMGEVEALQRLRRANAVLPLALLCIEEGHPKLAYQVLRAIPDERKSGLLHRTQGDALMYMGEYAKASLCYREASRLLPGDRTIYRRGKLAEEGSREFRGRILFPRDEAVHRAPLPQPNSRILPINEKTLLLITEREVIVRDGSHQAVPRPDGASVPQRLWQNEMDFVIEDQGGFEIWNKPGMRAVGRSPGKVLAVSRSLQFIVFFNGREVMLFDNTAKKSTAVGLAGAAAGTKACFDSGQTSLYILSPEGRLGQLDPQCRVGPIDWPSTVPDPTKIVVMAVHEKGLVALGSSDKQLLLLDRAKRTLIRRDLPFHPETLEISAEGESVLVTGNHLHGAFDRSGRLLYRGKGVCALDQSGRFLLTWSKSLSLYAMDPFHKLRSFSEQIPMPTQICWEYEGIRAVTADDNELRIWEVDEDNRVYERELLLTPGETYEDLIASYVQYQMSMREALQARDSRRFADAYGALCDARSARGFLQSEQALSLNWELSEPLAREGLEALWERIFFRGVTAAGISGDGRLLGMARGKRCDVLEFFGASTRPRFSLELASPVLALHFLESAILIAERSGAIHVLNQEDGSVQSTVQLEVRDAYASTFQNSHLLVWNKQGAVQGYDCTHQHTTPVRQADNLVAGFVAPLSKGLVLCGGPEGAKALDLNSGQSPGVIKLGDDACFLRAIEDEQVLLVGYKSGTVEALNLRSGKRLFALGRQGAPVTDMTLSLAMAYGVATSGNGHLSLFDANSGEEYISFTAHTQPIIEVEVTRDGRYLTTRSANGQFRLWETSWKLGERKQATSISWLPSAGALGKLGKLLGR